jgi:GTP-binding protein Era
MSEHRCGVVAIAGRPNVGKSTLLNRILGSKVAIVTPKPQTTRDRILGVRTDPGVQYLFHDTPGLHKPHKALNRRMVAEAEAALADADVVLMVSDAATPAEAAQIEGPVLAAVAGAGRPVVLAVNKIDLVRKGMAAMLPLIDHWSKAHPFEAIVPVCALSGDGVDRVLSELRRLLPEGPALYPEDELSDRPMRFSAAEIVREKLMMATAQEIPYSTAVTIDEFVEPEAPRAVRISATIHVERESQKRIVVGRGGAVLRAVGTEARQELEALLERKVMLKLFVKVSDAWTTTDEGLRRVGITDS